MDWLLFFAITVVVIHGVDSLVVGEVHFWLLFCLELGDLFGDGVVSAIVVLEQFYLFLEGLDLFLILFQQSANWFYLLLLTHSQPSLEMRMSKFQRIGRSNQAPA